MTPPFALVLGTMDFGTRVDPDRAYALLDRFVEAGGRWLDTADCYSFWNDPSGLGGASERLLGAWLAARPGVREQVRIATKVRQDPLVPHAWPQSASGLSAPAIRKAVAGCLDRLGIERIDLLWAHAEDRSVPLEETVGTFGELVAEGAVLRLGAANHPAWRVERARSLAIAHGGEPWSALQLRHSLVSPRPGTEVPDGGHRLVEPADLDYARTEGLDLWAYTPLLQGSYVRADRPLPEVYDHPGTTRVLTTLDEVAREVGTTRNQVVLAWLAGQGITPLVGVSSLDQLDEALAARTLALSDEQLERFTAAR